MYRIKQFIWAIESSFKNIEYKYLDNFLNKEEKELFLKLNKTEQHHSIRVCKNALEISKKNNYKEINKNLIAKAALLHDIGKIENNSNVIEKSILVILNKATKGKLKKYDYISKIDIYYNHGKKGEKMLKVFKIYDNNFLECIANHHNDIKSKNKLLEIIKESDDKS